MLLTPGLMLDGFDVMKYVPMVEPFSRTSLTSRFRKVELVLKE